MGMLVLSGYTDHEFVIGHEVKIKILEVRGDRVSLGFDAPDDIKIDRATVRRDKTQSPDYDKGRQVTREEE